MMRSATWLMLLLGAALLVTSNDAWARSRSNGRSSAAAAAARKKALVASTQRQIDAATTARGVAQAEASRAQGSIDSANGRIGDARMAIESAKHDGHEASVELRNIEHEIIESKGSDSEIFQTREQLVAALEVMQDAEHRVMNSAEVVAQLDEADQAADRAERIPKIRHEALLSDQKYQAALINFEVLRQTFSRLRSEIVITDQRWVAVSEAIRNAHRAEATAESSATASALQRLPATMNRSAAKKTIAAADSAISQGEALLKSIGPVKSGKGSSKGSSSSTSQKKK